MVSKFRKLNGDIYRIDEDTAGFSVGVFKKVGDSWIRVSGKLIPTLDFEGMPVSEGRKNKNMPRRSQKRENIRFLPDFHDYVDEIVKKSIIKA